MSKAIAIMGESGSGKTTSMRGLDPKTTYYIDCDGKGLSWKGWAKSYNAENKNYLKTNEAEKVLKALKGISESDKTNYIKTIIIDTMNGIMVESERVNRNTKGYDKWTDLAWSIWDILELILNLRDDLTIICTFHSQTDRDDNGNTWTRIKTSGRKLDKLVPESKFTTVLYSRRDDEGNYIFETVCNNSTAKTPLGAFETATIDNDITKVIKALEDF